MINKIGGLYFRFYENLSIRSIWENCPEFFDGYSLVITCLDSTEEVAKSPILKNKIMRSGWNLEKVGREVIYVPLDEVSKVLSDAEIFVQNDEVYLIKSPLQHFQGDLGHYTTDGFNFGMHVPTEFLLTFKSLNAIRYLSDGCGLNVGCESGSWFDKFDKIAITNQA